VRVGIALKWEFGEDGWPLFQEWATWWKPGYHPNRPDRGVKRNLNTAIKICAGSSQRVLQTGALSLASCAIAVSVYRRISKPTHNGANAPRSIL